MSAYIKVIINTPFKINFSFRLTLFNLCSKMNNPLIPDRQQAKT
jgi:hypothetical protein